MTLLVCHSLGVGGMQIHTLVRRKAMQVTRRLLGQVDVFRPELKRRNRKCQSDHN